MTLWDFKLHGGKRLLSSSRGSFLSFFLFYADKLSLYNQRFVQNGTFSADVWQIFGCIFLHHPPFTWFLYVKEKNILAIIAEVDFLLRFIVFKRPSTEKKNGHIVLRRLPGNICCRVSSSVRSVKRLPKGVFALLFMIHPSILQGFALFAF